MKTIEIGDEFELTIRDDSLGKRVWLESYPMSNDDDHCTHTITKQQAVEIIEGLKEVFGL